ncbi:MAG: AarF/ABC1/UbiB kinase family protein [Candidatus Melainabacteria bacterium]|nr:AarF/ABC1/UbiB kinase family protein [Candidatus Melainabacteria bacterium]
MATEIRAHVTIMTDSNPPELNPELDTALPLVPLVVDSATAVRQSTDPKNKFTASNSSGGLQYDAALADSSVRVRNLVTDRRFWQMAKTLANFSFEAFSDRIKPKFSKSELKRRRAVRLREALVELGPTFVKLGQFLSVRRDCLPIEIADELAMLQDKVPPFPIELVRSTIESDLGASPEQVFVSFDPQPIASASIGQVHRATLKDGHSVVVKVQRPDLSQLFYKDLGYMRRLAKWGLLIRPQGQWDSWLALSDEFGRTLFQEINYIQEGRNADRIRHVLRNHESMIVPRVFWKFTGRRVLTLEYLPGTKIDKVGELEQKGLNLAKIGNELVNSYLEQVLMHGFFHADPHAGNLSVNDEGKVIIYDFGMMGEISEAQREAITGCIAAVIKRDTADLIKNLTALGIVKADAKMAPVKRALEPFLEYYSGKELRDLDFSVIEHDIDQIAADKALTMPPNLAYLLRSGTTLEGIARTLRPNFSFVEAAKPALKKWILSRPANAATLLKVIFNITDDKLLKLAPGKNKNGARVEAEEVKFAAANLQEVSDLKAKVYLLETQMKAQEQKTRQLISLSLWLLVFPLIIATFANIPEYRSYANYFLIGNGVMGAIIMWHLVAPDSLAKRSKNSGQSRGQRR